MMRMFVNSEHSNTGSLNNNNMRLRPHGVAHGNYSDKLHWIFNWYNLLSMVFERNTWMSEEEYQSLCYSRAEAAAIVRENARLELERAKAVNEARTGASDIRDAIELGMTLEEYKAMVL